MATPSMCPGGRDGASGASRPRTDCRRDPPDSDAVVCGRNLQLLEFHRCARRGPGALAVGGIRAGTSAVCGSCRCRFVECAVCQSAGVWPHPGRGCQLLRVEWSVVVGGVL